MSNIPIRLSNCSPEGAATRRVLQRGGRVWVFRDVDGSPLGDRICTLPGLKSDILVLAPKGFGRPLLVRSGASGWKGIPNGEPCVSERWRDAGGVAAWLHAAGAPYRPGPLLALGDHSVGNPVFSVWRAQGLTADHRNMVLRILDVAASYVLPNASEDSDEMVIELVGTEPRLLMARIERAMLRLRATMPTLRVGAAAKIGVAQSVTDTLESGWIGLVPEHALDVWFPSNELTDEVGIASGRRVGRWKGPAMPDVDGLVSLCRVIVLDLVIDPDGGTIRVGLHGERGFRFFRVEYRKGTTHTGVASQVAASVCEHFFQVGSVTAVSVATVGEIRKGDGNRFHANEKEDRPVRKTGLCALWTEHVSAPNWESSDPVSAQVSELVAGIPLVPCEDVPVCWMIRKTGTFEECEAVLNRAHEVGWANV